jgi:hypothetical protein
MPPQPFTTCVGTSPRSPSAKSSREGAGEESLERFGDRLHATRGVARRVLPLLSALLEVARGHSSLGVPAPKLPAPWLIAPTACQGSRAVTSDLLPRQQEVSPRRGWLLGEILVADARPGAPPGQPMVPAL